MEHPKLELDFEDDFYAFLICKQKKSGWVDFFFTAFWNDFCDWDDQQKKDKY